jgi:hypothetical protein
MTNSYINAADILIKKGDIEIAKDLLQKYLQEGFEDSRVRSNIMGLEKFITILRPDNLPN